jgi:hypothetical protein
MNLKMGSKVLTSRRLKLATLKFALRRSRDRCRIGQQWGNNASEKAGFGKRRPLLNRDILAEGRSAAGRVRTRGSKVKWSADENVGSCQRDCVSPSDILAGVRRSGWREKNLGAKIDDTISGGGVFVPLGPPACRMVGEGFVRRVTEKKVTVVDAGS